jgi:membrane-bound lytic murein transglycosylase D
MTALTAARWMAAAFPLLLTGCGTAVRPLPTAAPAESVAGVPTGNGLEASPVDDPVALVIEASERHYREGERELARGHVDRARLAFDRALGLLLEWPDGGRAEPRLRDQFDRLVDAISAREVRAYAEGDGFTETRYEPASIDELLRLSATLTPATGSGLEAAAGDAAPHDVPIVLNPRVLAFIELFQGRLHDFIAEGLARGSQYLPMIQDVFRSEGLPLDLAYVPLVESAFKTNALSRARAKGIWQFMSVTAHEHGLRQDWYVDERSDPEKATVAAANYLASLVKMFEGDWHLALASYNSGPGRVQRAMRRSRLTDFWKIAARPGLLPRETRDYVPMVLAAIVIARNPAQYGFQTGPATSVPHETVVLPRPVDLRRLAEWADTTLDVIQTLNPALRRWTTPVRDTAYPVRVPLGTGDLIRFRVADARSVELASLRWHTVKAGESLSSIARTLRVTRADLAEANLLRVSARLTPGQQLIVPHEPAVLMAGAAPSPGVPPVVWAGTPALPELVRVTYSVRRGDTLGSIARRFGTSVAFLQSWNGLRDTRIQVNQRLTVYTAHTDSAAN